MSKTPSVLPAFKPHPARFGVLAFVGVLSMVTYLDRVCFGSVGPFIQTEFGLSNTQLGWLFFAFAFSYALFEIPTGWLGDVFGPRLTLIRIVLWWSAFTALTGAIYPIASLPLLAFGMLLAVRFFFGVGEAGAYPNITRALHNWFPLTERGAAQGAVWMAGRFAGGITPLVVLALVYRTPVMSGNAMVGEVVHWRHMFWIFGGIGVVWCVFFSIWFRDRPPGAVIAELAAERWEGPRASEKTSDAVVPAEQQEGARQGPTSSGPGGASGDGPGTAITVPDVSERGHGKVPRVRLRGIANLGCLCLMYFCAAYGWYFNITWLPKYLRNEFLVSEETHGFWAMSLMSGLPLLFGSLACLIGGFLTDLFISRTGNRKWGRRLFGIVGHSTCAICYFLSIAAPSPWLFVLFVALASFCNDLTMGAAWASCQDIGGEHTGIVSGCMNTVGNIGGAAAGILTGVVLEWGGPLGWTINFGNSVSIHLSAWTANFLIFGSVYLVAVGFWMLFDATKPVVE